MTERDDHQLLAEFARANSEAAFAALVQRHLGLVYSTALRSVGSAHAAEEVSQAVFIILAQKAGKLPPRIVLSGWLYQTTRLTAANFLRGEIRRQKREQEAYMQSTLNCGGDASSPETIWPQIAPLLDDALAKLGEADRNAIVLRFFENKSLAEVGAALGASEDAAKMRVNRALEKLRKLFGKRGVALSATLIAGAVSASSVQAAPAGLAATISTVALTKGVAAGGSTLTLVKGALKIMAWTKMKTAVVVGVGVLLAVGTATVTVKEIQEHRTYPWQAGGREGWFSGSLLDRQPPQVRILSSSFTNFAEGSFGNKMMGTGIWAQGVVAAAYGASSARTILSTTLPEGRYDYIASLPQGNAEALQREVRSKFGVVGKIETRDTDVLMLKVKTPGAPGLKRSVNLNHDDFLQMNTGGLQVQNKTMTDLTSQLQALANIPILDQTGLTNRYDFNIHLNWDLTPGWWKLNPNLRQPSVNMDNVKQALLDQLGLELVPTNMPIEMLVVEKAK